VWDIEGYSEDIEREIKMPDYSYEDFMIFTGQTDQFLGRLYKCPRCGKRYWSAWGWARRHYEKEIKKLRMTSKNVVKG